MTEWRVVSMNERYEVSNDGRIRVRECCRTPQTQALGDVTQTIRRRGDKAVCALVNLWKGTKFKTYRVHRLVLIAFVGDPPEGCEGCHNDGDATNNAVANLRWDTHVSNMLDRVAHGTNTPPPTFRGEDSPRAKLTTEAVLAIRAAQKVHGIGTRLSRQFGVSHMTIRRIRNGLTWAHVA